MNQSIVINGKFLPAKIEGMPRVGREITACLDALLDEERYRHLTITMAVPQGAGGLAAYKNIPVVEVGRFRGQLWEQFDFPRFAGENYTLNFTGTAPLLKNKGCVVVHDAQFFSTPKSHTLKTFVLYGVITPLVAKSYTSIVTVSNYAKKEILAYEVCKREDIHIAPNGADHVLRRRLDPEAVARFGLVRHAYALANSYVHAHKNVRILLEVFGRDFPDRKLALFGTSERRDYEERGIAVPDNVVFLGRVSDDELVSLMASAQMFLFPSTTEGFGLPPLEAMLLGCPTICASAGAMPEICGDGALYADPYSQQAWAQQIGALWGRSDARERLSEAGRRQASKFKWMHAAQQYLDVIVADLERGQARRAGPSAAP